MDVDIGHFSISGSIIMAVVCAILASAKGRSVIGWGIGGFFFSCFALIFLLCLGDLPVERQEALQGARTEARHVKETMRRHEARAAQQAEEARLRLDAHDVALGIDTRPVAGLNPPHLPEDLEGPVWFYEDGGRAAGPISQRALRALRQSGALPVDVLVWKEGMPGWRPMNTTLPA